MQFHTKSIANPCKNTTPLNKIITWGGGGCLLELFIKTMQFHAKSIANPCKNTTHLNQIITWRRVCLLELFIWCIHCGRYDVVVQASMHLHMQQNTIKIIPNPYKFNANLSKSITNYTISMPTHTDSS